MEQQTKPLYEAEIGDYVRIEDLLAAGARFYTLGNESYCDLPTMTFKLNPFVGKGYWRIE